MHEFVTFSDDYNNEFKEFKREKYIYLVVYVTIIEIISISFFFLPKNIKLFYVL
jgi:hypothetical protein